MTTAPDSLATSIAADPPSAHHEAPLPVPAHVELAPAKYRAKCPTCGTWTETVNDRATAVQAALGCCKPSQGATQ